MGSSERGEVEQSLGEAKQAFPSVPIVLLADGERPDQILEALGQGRHFGLGGMRERAVLAGGDLSVESAPGEGCVLSVWVPTEIVPRAVGPAETPAATDGAEPSDTLPGRSVPGYTWQ